MSTQRVNIGTMIDPDVAFENPVIRGFCSHAENASLILRYTSEPSPENLEKLNRAFKIYFFAIRFTKYLSSLVRMGRIDFDRKNKRTEERELVIFNRPISDEEESEIGEILANVYQGDDLPQVTVDPEVFHSQLNNEWLYEGFSQLTPKQKFVITLAYSASLQDTEIANHLHVSQQAVSKTRTTALKKIRRFLPPIEFSETIKRGGTFYGSSSTSAP